MATSPKKKETKPSSDPTSVILKLYLTVYNLACFYGWGLVLYHTIIDLFVLKWSYQSLYYGIGREMRMIQTLAVLEIFNSAFGFVKSPVSTTTVQVFSRLFIVWLVLDYFDSVQSKESLAFTTLTFAWSITEIVRYLYYALSQFNKVPFALLWLRYTTFLPLYPIGVASEMTLVYQSLDAASKIHSGFFFALILILSIYPPGLYTLYTYMMKQRTRNLYPSSLKRVPSEINTSPKKKNKKSD
ncbi:tyrosine phosphatase-like protein [Paraphysoderma sedebokerense]|nr:tyrosine phosphatase-like protein [Paraphysoderma sedebokerense]